jgi:alginate O-acetyltransferase complex protein AlgI
VLFNTFEFVVFLLVAWSVYRLLQRWRMPRLLWLLVISYFFYGCWKPWYLLLIAASTLNSYLFGFLIDQAEGRRRKLWMALSVTADLLLLGVFKYGNFLLGNLEWALMAGLELGPLPRLPTALPVGISFYTFQTISYTVDLYWKRIPKARNLLEFSVFVAFFPQLVAGPIVRARSFLPQLLAPPVQDPKAIGAGLFLILAGLTKKMVLADTLYAAVVRPYFEAVGGHSAIETIGVLWAANFQVYCDFSGYSDVAIGAALLFGLKLPENFDRPFWSQTPMEHWRRWHISLSTWLRDYLYIPLGGSRSTAESRVSINLVITFLLGGLWHGAGWTFVVWGLWNGLLLVAWRKWGPGPGKTLWGKAWRIFLTYNALCVGLIFLHARSFGDAWQAILSLGAVLTPNKGAFDAWGLLLLAAAIALHATPRRWKATLKEAFAIAPAWSLGLAVVVVGAVLSLFAGYAAPFFYFQF